MNIMKFNKTNIEDLYFIENNTFKDIRGSFTKIFNSSTFEVKNLNFTESYYSISSKYVLRGMHFQEPPHGHTKLVHVISGKILDVVLDIRKNSKTYGNFFSTILKSQVNSILIPEGCAHGFLSLTDTSIVTYYVTSLYEQASDNGIRWNSFGFEWPCQNPIISERDNNFTPFSLYNTPF